MSFFLRKNKTKPKPSKHSKSHHSPTYMDILVGIGSPGEEPEVSQGLSKGLVFSGSRIEAEKRSQQPLT